MEIRPNSSANSTTHPRPTPLASATLRFLLTNYLASRFSRVTLCFRRSGVSGSYIRAAAAGTSSLASFPSSKVQASFAALRHICMYNVYTCTCWLSRCRNVLYSLYEYLKFCSDTSRTSRRREVNRKTASQYCQMTIFLRESWHFRHLKNYLTSVGKIAANDSENIQGIAYISRLNYRMR